MPRNVALDEHQERANGIPPQLPFILRRWYPHQQGDGTGLFSKQVTRNKERYTTIGVYSPISVSSLFPSSAGWGCPVIRAFFEATPG